MRRWAAPLLLAVVVVTVPAGAQGLPTIRVAVELQQSTAQSRDTVQGSGSVIITERGSVRPRGGIGVEGAERRVRRSSGIVTLVHDGGEALLTVATQVPAQQIAFFRDYATGAGHVATGVVFRDVGTALRVQASLMPGHRVRVRMTPRISYIAPDGSGAIEFMEAATEMVVPSGRPVVLAGSTRETHAVMRQILGVGHERRVAEITVVLTATVQ